MLEGKISFGQPSGDGCDYITIEVIDESSGTEFVEVHVKYADFARAITGSGRIDCEFELRPEHVGKKRETKEEIVKVSRTGNNQASAIERALKPFEIDGWKGYRQDASNHHRVVEYSDKFASYRVTFYRYV